MRVPKFSRHQSNQPSIHVKLIMLLTQVIGSNIYGMFPLFITVFGIYLIKISNNSWSTSKELLTLDVLTPDMFEICSEFKP